MLPVLVAPKPGFCIKSITLSPGILPPLNPNPNLSLLEPAPSPIHVPPNRKVFVNIAWDPSVPPPPEGSEEAIHNAMQGQDMDEDNPKGWYVPVIVSNAREDKDKVGNPSIVIDCIFNTSVKARTLRDPEFKIFLIELALQRVEAQTGLSLSRSIATPNIASKGKLLPRTVQIPAALFSSVSPQGSTTNESTKGRENKVIAPSSSSTNQKPPLIQEISSGSTSLPGLRGILKSSASSNTSATVSMTEHVNSDEPLTWTWSKSDINGASSSPNSDRLKIEIHVPGLTPNIIALSTLDITARTLDLTIPNRRPLSINLRLSDGEIASHVASTYHSKAKATLSEEELDQSKAHDTARTLQLKRQRDFDVDGAEAEWKTGSGVVVVFL